MSILSSEISVDPLTKGYAGMSDLQIVQLINTVDRTVNRTSISGREILSQQNNADYAALSDAKKSQWIGLTGHDNIDPFGPAVQVVIDIWGVTSQTVLNLQASRTKTVSRAQELGLGSVDEGDVLQARA